MASSSTRRSVHSRRCSACSWASLPVRVRVRVRVRVGVRVRSRVRVRVGITGRCAPA